MKNINTRFMRILAIVIFAIGVVPICLDGIIREVENSYGHLLRQPGFVIGLLIVGIIFMVLSIGLSWVLGRKNLTVDQVKLKFVLIMIFFQTGFRLIVLSLDRL